MGSTDLKARLVRAARAVGATALKGLRWVAFGLSAGLTYALVAAGVGLAWVALGTAWVADHARPGGAD